MRLSDPCTEVNPRILEPNGKPTIDELQLISLKRAVVKISRKLDRIRANRVI